MKHPTTKLKIGFLKTVKDVTYTTSLIA